LGSLGGELLLNAQGRPYGVAGSLGRGFGSPDVHWFIENTMVASLNARETGIRNTLDTMSSYESLARPSSGRRLGDVPDIVIYSGKIDPEGGPCK